MADSYGTYDEDMPSLSEICRDLDAEQRELDGVVSGLTESEWNAGTPAVGWSIKDQVAHLAFFDEVGALAASDPDAFNSQLAEVAADPARYIQGALDRGRAMSGEEVLGWWRVARGAALETLSVLDPDARIPWFGPPMKAASFVTARLMETWAHAQDVLDSRGLRPRETDRLRHVAHIGVRARGFSFHTNGLAPPEADVFVELTGPRDELWTWGASEVDRVTGTALDFCLVVTQRRHLADTDLRVEGPAAEAWMSIAQSFAGPPGEGRRPGQFPKASRANN